MMALEPWVSYGLGFGAAALAGVATYPPLAQRIAGYIRRKAAEGTVQLSDIFLHYTHRTVWMVYAVSPVVVGALAWMVTGSWLVGCLGTALGVLVPTVVVAQMRRIRRKRFHAQLVDGLLVLTSSLKAGLSMTQAFTVLVEEMPPPISQEFGLVLKESRMGVPLEEALAHFRGRVPGDEVKLFVTAVLVARETGGDVTQIFTRLVETLRERRRLKERLKTLTFMARMQGFIMALLPVIFGYLVFQMSPDYLRFFLTHPTGRRLLVIIVLLQGVGWLLFLRFSRSPFRSD
jgi:tight adherence protein B